MAPIYFKQSTKANLEAALSAPAVASTQTASIFVDTKRGVKRVREDEVDGATQEVPSPIGRPPNEEAQKHDEQAGKF